MITALVERTTGDGDSMLSIAISESGRSDLKSCHTGERKGKEEARLQEERLQEEKVKEERLKEESEKAKKIEGGR